jgi:hypothetical protein
MGRRWMLRRLPPCDQIVPVISESLDHKPSLRMRLVLKLHLFVCMRCMRYLRQLLFMRTALRAKSARLLEEELKEVHLSADARERMKRSLKSEGNS